MWLISTIYDTGKISFEDIARKWDNAYINDLHQPLKLRTFHHYITNILNRLTSSTNYYLLC